MSSESMAALKALDNSYVSLAEAVEPAVVNIKVHGAAQPGLVSEDGGGAVEGEGSGVIIRPDGYIITNDHVVAGMDKVTVSLTDGREFPGKVIRGSGREDIAVIKINATNLPTLPFADSNKVKAGQIAMAVGSPFGLDNSVTIGHISALDRGNDEAHPMMAMDPRAPGGYRAYFDLIQTDTAINPGNSGGALVNIDGELVGVNTMIESHSGTNSGAGFAIPSNEVRLISDLLINKGTVNRAYMGLAPQAIKDYQKAQLGVSAGAYVGKVEDGTPASKAGLKVGDVIVRIGSTPIATYTDLRDVMYEYAPGATVSVEYVRDGKHQTTSVKLEAPKAIPAAKSQMMPQQGESNPFGDSFPFGDGRSFRFQQPNQSPVAPRTGEPHLGAKVEAISSDTRGAAGIPASEKGVLVVSVEPGSVAEEIGLQPGDVITSFNGKAVTTPDALVNAIKGTNWGDQRSLAYDRFSGGNRSQMERSFPFK
jgi:serine protease Do